MIRDYFRRILGRARFQRTGSGFNINLNFAYLGKKLDVAQYMLDTQVWQDMQQYMPLDTGQLISETNALNAVTAGSGKVYIYNPDLDYAHYQHEGYVYVDPKYGKGAFYSPAYGFWSRPGITKEKTDRKLQYSNPSAVDHWENIAIENHKDEWVELVKRALE